MIHIDGENEIFEVSGSLGEFVADIHTASYSCMESFVKIASGMDMDVANGISNLEEVIVEAVRNAGTIARNNLSCIGKVSS